MLNLIRNEIVKLVHSKKFMIFLACIILLFGYKVISTYNEATKMTPSIRIKSNEEKIINLKAKLASDEITKEKKAKISLEIKSLEEENKILEEELTSSNSDWRENIKKRINVLQESKKELYSEIDQESIEEVDSKIKYYNYYLEKNIEPKKEYDFKAFENMPSIIEFMNIFFLPLLIVILCSDMIAGEHYYSTIKVLLTKAAKRSTIFNSKILASIFTIVSTLFLAEIVVFLFIGIVFGFGNANSPMIIGTQYTIKTILNSEKLVPILGTSYIIPVWKVLLSMAAYQLIFSIVCITFVTAISTFFTKNTISLVINFAVMSFTALITFIFPLSFMRSIYPFLFTTYCNGSDIICGNLQRLLNNPNINVTTSLLVSGLWFIICYFPSLMLFTKRDVLN